MLSSEIIAQGIGYKVIVDVLSSEIIAQGIGYKMVVDVLSNEFADGADW